jgi:hypothetical protein
MLKVKTVLKSTDENNEENINTDILQTSMNLENLEKSEFKNKRVPMDGIELLLNREKVPDSLGKKLDKKNIKESNVEIIDDPLTDLDDIISDAESLNNKKKFSPVQSRENDRMKRRIVKRRNKPDRNVPDRNVPDRNVPDRNVPDRNVPDRNVPDKTENKDKVNQDFFPPKFNNPSSSFQNIPFNENKGNQQGSQHISQHSSQHSSQQGSQHSSQQGSQHSSQQGSDSESEQGSQCSESVSGESNGSKRESIPNLNSQWKSPSSMSKDEIMSEKMDLLYRYSRLEGNGYKSGLNLNMRTSLEILRTEVSKLERMRNVQRSVRTQRKLLISFASGTEYVNKRYNPYKFALDGWSGDVLENIGDYDEVFEELHDKYKESVQMSPEIKLLTMVGGSGLMFHLSNTLFKSSTPELNDILQNNPDIMAQIQKAALGSMANANAGDPLFNMMMNGINERNQQQAQQAPWEGRKGYAPPRTSQGFPQPSNMNSTVEAEVNQVPQGQGLFSQQTMQGPQGFDDILNQLNSNSMDTGLISDVEEDKVNTKEVSTKQRKNKPKNFQSKKKTEVIDLDM